MKSPPSALIFTLCLLPACVGQVGGAGGVSAAAGAGAHAGTGPAATASSCAPSPAPRQLRLLSRREYRNTIRDLFPIALPSDPTATFPVEAHPRKGGLSDPFPFDDESQQQVVSPTHVAEYWKAAATVAGALGAQVNALVACAPGSDAGACAERFVRDFGLRAWRRPLTDAEVARYQRLVMSSSSGRLAAVRAFLSSPNFLYRAEGSQPAGGGSFRLTGYDVATALSYTIWGSMPDAALFDAAAAGTLTTPAGIASQARRMLSDPRSRDTVGDFVSQWVGAGNIATADKEPALFPALTPDLRASMVQETRRLASSVVFDASRTYRELLLADYSVVDAALAAFYGMAGVSGPGFVKHAYADQNRAGLLGHASILGVYARSDQTSPIKRGLFVRRRLLCQDLPPPPPDAPPVPAVDQTLTTRERFRQHTSEPRCASCHQFIDDVGFGWENFDAIGRYRETENGQPIDSTGDMNNVEGLDKPSHAPYRRLPELARILANSQAAPDCFATQYLRFARGTFESPDTSCTLQQVQSRFRVTGGDIQELIVALTQTPDFLDRR